MNKTSRISKRSWHGDEI